MAWQTLDQQYKQEADRNDRSNYLKDIIAGLSIASNNRPDTLLGYGLGRWLSNYVNRGLERRQQDKNQQAYDEWMRGQQGIPGQAISQQGAPAENQNAAFEIDPNKIAANMINAAAPQESYVERALAENGVNTNGNYFSMPQQQTTPTAQQIASQITGRPQMDHSIDMSSAQVYQQAYDIARRSGSTEDQARKFAQQRAELYQSQRVQSLSDSFLNGGIGQDGTITDRGVQILARLAEENPQQTNMLANMYQTPQGATRYAQDIDKMTINNAQHLQNSREMANLQYTLSQLAADANVQRQIQMLDEKERRQFDNAYKSGYIAALMGGASEDEAKMYGQLNAFQSLGGLAGGGRGSSGGGSRGGASSSNELKENKQHYDQLKDWLERYEKTNRDPISGEWKDGKGPGDREYDSRLKRYNSFTADPNDDPDIDVSSKENMIISLRQHGHTPEEAQEKADRFFGKGSIGEEAQKEMREAAQPTGNALTPDQIRDQARQNDFIEWLKNYDSSRPIFGPITNEDRSRAEAWTGRQVNDLIAGLNQWARNFADREALRKQYAEKERKQKEALDKVSYNRLR